MTVNIANIIVGHGNLYVANKNIALELFGAAGRDPYHVGGTSDGVEVAYEPEYTDIVIDQFKDAAMIYQNGYKVSLRTNLAEATLANLQVAWGMYVAADGTLLLTGTTSAGTTQRLSLTVPPDEPNERKVVVIGRSPSDKERKYFGRRAISAETSSHALKRAEMTMFPISFRLLADPNYSGAEYGYVEDNY